jgi:hypothetical protein
MKSVEKGTIKYKKCRKRYYTSELICARSLRSLRGAEFWVFYMI